MPIRISPFGFKLVVIVAVFAAGAARAEVYKWVDKNGVTNYSAEPPRDLKAAKKVAVVEERLSTYTPNAPVSTAIAVSPTPEVRAVADKLDSMQRQLDAERLQRQTASSAARETSAAAHERCVAERRVDCDNAGLSNAPIIVVGRRRPPLPFVPTVNVTGVTAGNVVNAIAATGASVSRTPGAPSGNAPNSSAAPSNDAGVGLRAR